jgi:ABC-2 type transport system permease protein
MVLLSSFFRRDWAIDVSYRAAYVLQFVSSLFLLTLFFYLGRVIDNSKFSASQGVGGGYFDYVVIGLAVLEIVQVSLSSFSHRLREEQTSGTLEALLGTPAAPSLIILSSAAYDLLRALLAGTLVIVVAVLVFGVHLAVTPTSIAIALAAIVGSLGLFASLGIAVAGFTVVFKQAPALLTMVVYGLALLGGVYFPTSVLPPAIQTLANALPFTWGLDVLRAALLGGHVNFVQLAGVFASAAVLLPLALVIFGAALRQARRTGSLTQY